jgi:hypothetical protein
VEEVKTLSNKLIVKGSVLSDVVISSNDGSAERINFTSAFSFIAETDCEHVSDNVSMCIIPTALYYELSGNGHVLSFAIINQGVERGSMGRSFQDQVCIAITEP